MGYWGWEGWQRGDTVFSGGTQILPQKEMGGHSYSAFVKVVDLTQRDGCCRGSGWVARQELHQPWL